MPVFFRVLHELGPALGEELPHDEHHGLVVLLVGGVFQGDAEHVGQLIPDLFLDLGNGQLVIHTISLQLCRELPQIIPNQKIFLCIICIIHEIERKIKCKYGYARKKTAARALGWGKGAGPTASHFPYHTTDGPEKQPKSPQNGALAGNFFPRRENLERKKRKGLFETAILHYN